MQGHLSEELQIFLFSPSIEEIHEYQDHIIDQLCEILHDKPSNHQ